MALPVINKPKQKCVTPVSKKSGTIYPFTMKQQKHLLIAEQSQDDEEIVDAISTIITECSTYNPEELSPAEFQWVFLQIRLFSVGSLVDAKLNCVSCSEETSTKIDLNTFGIVSKEKMDKKLMIDESLGIMLKEPSMSDAKDDKGSLAVCIDYVFDAENVYKLQDYTEQERNDFIDSIPAKVAEEIVKFTKTFGELVLDKDWVCPHCGHKNHLHISGIGSFFK